MSGEFVAVFAFLVLVVLIVKFYDTIVELHDDE